MVSDLYLEDLIQIDQLKYTLVRVKNMESAETLIKYSNSLREMHLLKLGW